MKKLFSIILIACLAMAVMAVAPVSAANNEVLRGTPVIDGEIDEIYKQSLTIVYTGKDSDNAGAYMEGRSWPAGGTTIHALYDASYLYLVAEVEDDDVVSAAESFVYGYDNPYGNDVVEFRLDLGGSAPNVNDTFFKIGIDAYGMRAYSPASVGIGIDVDTLEYATTITDKGYIVEVKVPHDTRDSDDLYGSGKLGLKVWVFDLPAENAGIKEPKDGEHFYMYAQCFEGEGIGDRVFYNLSDEKAVDPSAGKTDDTTAKQDDTTAKQDDTTAKQDDTTAKQDDTTAGKTDDTTAGKTDDTTAGKTNDTPSNPTTFDPVVIAVVLTAASGAAFVVASKKRH